MGKRGPKPSSPDGAPKKRVTMALASDVIDFMRSHKPTVPWLESVMRDLRAEESRDSGGALPLGSVIPEPAIYDGTPSLYAQAVALMRNAYLSGEDELLRQWTSPRHADHLGCVTRILNSRTMDKESSYRCSRCRETLLLNYEIRMEDGILSYTITPTVSFE